MASWPTLVLLAAASPTGQAADVAYPAEPAREVVRFFGLEKELDRPALEESLAELGARLLYGPVSAGSQPGQSFVALAAPASTDERALTKALKSAGTKPVLLRWIAFEGREGTDEALPNFGKDFAGRDHILGMSGDIRWFDSAGGRTQFYVTPRKLGAEDIQERYEKLYAPFGGGRIGDVARDRLTWELRAPVDPKRAAKLEKAVLKLPGVESAHVDAEGRRLEVSVRLEDLETSGPTGSFPGASAGGPPRATWDTNPLHELLVEEELLDPPSAGAGD